MVPASEMAAIVALFFSSSKRKTRIETNPKAAAWLALFAMLMTLFVPLAQPEMAARAVMAVESASASTICHSGITTHPAPFKNTAKMSPDCSVCQTLAALAAGYVAPPDVRAPVAPEVSAPPLVRIDTTRRIFVVAAAWPRGPPILA